LSTLASDAQLPIQVNAAIRAPELPLLSPPLTLCGAIWVVAPDACRLSEILNATAVSYGSGGGGAGNGADGGTGRQGIIIVRVPLG